MKIQQINSTYYINKRKADNRISPNANEQNTNFKARVRVKGCKNLPDDVFENYYGIRRDFNNVVEKFKKLVKNEPGTIELRDLTEEPKYITCYRIQNPRYSSRTIADPEWIRRIEKENMEIAKDGKRIGFYYNPSYNEDHIAEHMLKAYRSL